MNWADSYKAAKRRASEYREQATDRGNRYNISDARMLAALLAIEAQLEAIRLRLDEGIPR